MMEKQMAEHNWLYLLVLSGSVSDRKGIYYLAQGA